MIRPSDYLKVALLMLMAMQSNMVAEVYFFDHVINAKWIAYVTMGLKWQLCALNVIALRDMIVISVSLNMMEIND